MSKRKLQIEIVVPVYNEEKELKTNTLKLYSFLKKEMSDYSWRIMIADNASIDKTPQIGRELAQKFPEISYHYFPKKGRGRAVKNIWKKSEAEFLTYMDIDLSTDLKSFPILINSLEKGADIAIGNRLLSESTVVGRTLKRELISRIYNLLTKLIFKTHFSDAQCGFKGVRKQVFLKLLPLIKNNQWFFDSELLIIADKAGFNIAEIPVRWVDNPGSTVRVLKTALEDLSGLWRVCVTQPWKKLS